MIVPANPRIAIAGATGAVGETLRELIVARNFPYQSLHLLASQRSAGRMLAAPSNFTMLMNKGEKIWSQAMPVLTGRSDCPEITIAANGVEALDDSAAGALSRLYEACRDPLHRQDVALRHGQALLINNRKGVHARSAFNPTFGPHERWLLRANVRRDIWGMRGRWTGRDLVFA